MTSDHPPTERQMLPERERRQAAEVTAEMLRASQERVRLATEAGGPGVWSWNVNDDRVTWEHDWLYDMFGLAHDEEPLNAERFTKEFVHPEDLPRFTAAIAAVLEKGEPFSFIGRFLRQPLREVRWLEFHGALQPSDDGQPCVLGTAADITDRYVATEALRESEERYRALFNAMDEGFCTIELVTDEQGQTSDYIFLETNPAFEKHTGLVGVNGRSMRELVPDHDQHWFDMYGEVGRTGEPARFVNEAAAMNRWFDVYAMRMSEGPPARLALFFNDITARVQAQQDLRRLADELAAADQRKTEFLATLAHELRNPLAPVRNALEIMRRNPSDAAAQHQARDLLERQVNHMVRLIDDLMDIARISRGHIELQKTAVSLQALVASAVETSQPLIDEGHHQLQVDLPPDAITLQVDPTRMAQALSNLLNNAAKYTPPGGHLRLHCWLEDEQLHMAVSDNGVGITPDALGSVFDMFTQAGRSIGRSQGGLGIGLSVVRHWVELHGGSVSASSPGHDQGSTFTLSLPMEDSKALAAPVANGPAETHDKHLKVLVVDDNQDAANSLALLMTLEGHESQAAYDGGQALAMAPDFAPDVVFLDIGMPVKNGYEVAQSLRQMPGMQNVVLVALTGWGTADDRARSQAAGFHHHLTKPADLATIDALLHTLSPAH